MLATAPQIARAQLSGAPPHSPIQMPHISSTVRARSGMPTPTTTETLHMRASNASKGIVGYLCPQKVLAQRQHLLIENARNSRGCATDRSPIQMRYLVRYTGPEWRTHAHNRRNATRVCSQQTRRDASRDPFALKRCVLETCGTSKLLAERPTSRPSKSIILSVTRVVSGASTHTCTETLRMLILAPPKRLPGPLCTVHSKRAHNIRHLRARAHLLDERATSCSSKLRL